MGPKLKRIGFIIASIALPFIVWISAEKIANSITHRFDPLKVDNEKGTYYLNKDYFTDFFFYRLEHFFNISTSNRVIHKQKGDRYRIFVLGGSTAAGYPYNTLPEYQCAASFPNYLRAILLYNEDMPEIEVLNAASNAFNSQTILQVMKDLKKYQPDLFIIYTGHNEYFGPNEFALSRKANLFISKRAIYSAVMSLRQTYLYQGLRWLIGKIFHSGEAEYKDYASWSLENKIKPNDPYHKTVIRNFEKNLRDIIRVGRKSGAKVLVCTPISNVTFPPFISVFSRELTDAEKVRWDSLAVSAEKYYLEENYEEAIRCLEEMNSIDPEYAKVHYYLGMNLAKIRDYDRAAEELKKSVECDALPFRARARIREICREVARQEGAILADTERFFVNLSGKNYPAPYLLLDHVHPIEEGYYYLGLFLAKTIIDNHLIPNVDKIKYPPLDKTREVLGIYDFVVDKVEYDFVRQSYLRQLSDLNKDIKGVLVRIQKRAYDHAKRVGEELMRKQYQELENEKKQEQNQNK